MRPSRANSQRRIGATVLELATWIFSDIEMRKAATNAARTGRVNPVGWGLRISRDTLPRGVAGEVNTSHRASVSQGCRQFRYQMQCLRKALE